MANLNPFKVGVVQMDVFLSEKGKNLDRMKIFAERAAAEGVQFLIYPECSLTGYCFISRDEAKTVAETIPGPATSFVQNICSELKMLIVFGMIELDGDNIHNSAVIVSQDGIIGKHRKVQLPHLALDHHIDKGNLPISVHDAKLCMVGMNICYDIMFPEMARIQALKGADLLVIPTNWPTGARSPRVVSTRAIENRVYCVAADRVGSERGYTFMGSSIICDPDGEILAKASIDKEEIITATVDPNISRDKKIVRDPNFWMDYMKDRRPEMYRDILKGYF